MIERKSVAVIIGLVLAILLIATSVNTILLTNYYDEMQMQVVGDVLQRVIEKQPEAEQILMSTLKEYKYDPTLPREENLLIAYGYGRAVLGESPGRRFALIGFAVGGALFLSTFLLWRKMNISRINGLTAYLEKVNAGATGVLLQNGEDVYSGLQDEIYKTVTMLYQTRDAAIAAKNNYAENLDNIAHQIKTPITAISLSTQMMKKNPSPEYLEQIQKQTSRLAHLEEALLLLSRIDAGTLALNRKKADVFTILTLAADNLQELFARANVFVDIQESGEAATCVDMDWTMEAIMNLMKNCMEHTPSGGTVHCAYEQNPLYTQIRIWDTGTGFAREDIPHLFERFYRGKRATGEGIGIGLALSKAIIERQNGTISARNHEAGGACFEIHFYSH